MTNDAIDAALTAAELAAFEADLDDWEADTEGERYSGY